MIEIKTTILIFFLITALGYSQTPEQSYFEWTDLSFTKEELDQRRDKLMSLLATKQKTGLVLIPARDGYSHGETFRQADDFYYFTGLELPNAILVLDLRDRSGLIYTPERDLRFESSTRKNDFPGRPLLSDKTITERAGIKLASFNDFSALMDLEASKSSTVFI
ncbi:MAG: hypothetical protein HKN90_09005, partial [Flavobacteriaceae bacterium]|nr:hypothetical protein [Flavobacteriaceae bacterium]